MPGLSEKNLDKRGYGQLELNQVAFRRDGRIEAQRQLAEGIERAENGMLLVVNPKNNAIELPNEENVTLGTIALHYSAEHMYDNRANSLKDFVLEAHSFLPRLGYLSIGDKYTTNTVRHNYDTDEELFRVINSGTLLFAHPHSTGYHYLNENPVGAIAVALYVTTMPDGQNAIKFQVVDTTRLTMDE